MDFEESFHRDRKEKAIRRRSLQLYSSLASPAFFLSTTPIEPTCRKSVPLPPIKPRSHTFPHPLKFSSRLSDRHRLYFSPSLTVLSRFSSFPESFPPLLLLLAAADGAEPKKINKHNIYYFANPPVEHAGAEEEEEEDVPLRRAARRRRRPVAR
jgi:hypothetical protein